MKLAVSTFSAFVLSSPIASAQLADSHTLFLDDCQPAGCAIKVGTTNATTNTSDIPTSASTVRSFARGGTSWANILSCVSKVMSPFDLTVTDQRPSSGNYFRVVVAGMPGDLSLNVSTLEITDTACQAVGNCSPYISKALGFVFANSGSWSSDDTICAAAARVAASSFALDHVVDASDVMSFNTPSGLQAFHDGEACGSDCVSGMSPFGLTCTGSGGNATHLCTGTGTATQDEVQTLLALFGPAKTSNPDAGQAGAGGAGQGGRGGNAGLGGVAGSSDAGRAGSSGSGGSGGAVEAGTDAGTHVGPHAGTDAGTHANSGGQGGAGGDAGSHTAPASSDDSGCGCRIAREKSTPFGALLLTLSMIPPFARRWRRRR